jgi:hypothetical protein
MSIKNLIGFLTICQTDAGILEKFKRKNLPEILLHAKNIGYSFTSDELSNIVGNMENYIITKRMGEEINASSSLWPKMWGKYHLQYVVEDLFNTIDLQELNLLLSS